MTTTVLPKTSHPSGLHFFRRNPHPSKERHGDCCVRAITLATDTEYKYVKFAADDAVIQRHDGDEPTWGYKKYMTSYGGMYDHEVTATINNLAKGINFKLRHWKHITLNTTFHVDNLPEVCIVEQSDHYVAVKNGAIYDSWDSRGKTKKLKKVRSVYCHIDEWKKFMNKHNGDLREAGVIE